MESKKVPGGRGGESYDEPEQDLTEQQLAKIGAIAINFNYAEQALDRILLYSLNIFGNLWLDTVKRFAGIEAKTDLSKISVKHIDRIITKGCKLHMLAVAQDYVEIVGAFTRCRRYRDHILHSVIYNHTPTIGMKYGYKGEEAVGYCLMTTEALGRMLDEIRVVRRELEAVERYCSLVRPSVVAYEQHRSILTPSPHVDECLEQLRCLRESRRRLGPYPTFPSQL